MGLVPEVSPYLKIKFPTADADKGLGTGEFDETLGVDFTKTFFERLVGYLTLAYTFRSSRCSRGRRAIAPGEADPLEIVFGAEYRLTKALKLTGSVGKGLSDGSPDWEITGGFTVRF